MRSAIRAMQAIPGPSKVPLRKTPPPPPTPSVAQTSPLPGPIRRSAAALPTKNSPIASTPTAGAATEAEKLQSAKTLADSYRALTPNTRIIFGLAIGVVGLVGLYWDRWVAPEASREGEKPLVAIRVVDRER